MGEVLEVWRMGPLQKMPDTPPLHYAPQVAH